MTPSVVRTAWCYLCQDSEVAYSWGTQPFSRDGPWGCHEAILTWVTSETLPKSQPCSWVMDPSPGLHLTLLFMAISCIWRDSCKGWQQGAVCEIFFWYPALKFWTTVERGHKKVLLPPKIPWKLVSDLLITAWPEVPCWLLGFSHCREAFSAWLAK